MFCDRCGARVGADHEFCHSCGKRLLLPAAAGYTAAAVGYTTAAAGRVPRPGEGGMGSHFRTLGILWLVISGLRLIPAGALLFSGRLLGPFPYWHANHDIPFFVPGLLTGIGSVFAVSAVLGLVAGFGLLERRPWARMLAIVLGIFALPDFPFGTALGIYSLWVLLSTRGESESRQWA